MCPDDALKATPILDVLAPEAAKWDFMQTLPNRGNLFDKSTVRGSQFQQPLMEFSGACEGCGETPYVKREYSMESMDLYFALWEVLKVATFPAVFLHLHALMSA